LGENPIGIRAQTIQLVDEGQAGDIVSLHLPVDSQGLTLHSAHGAQNQNGTIQNSKGALHFHREIHVTWGVDNIDVGVLPQGICSCRLDGDPPLSLQLHAIHGGPHIILSPNFVHFRNSSGVKENSLRQRRLATVYMRRDSYIPDLLDGLVLRELGMRTVASLKS